ncbi:MarR family winged helix-turn-helix transcriptional regulator [Streptomyces solicathayae]|uniref:MarR family transcriptional regulator n=1 Tax=Streptomyces solicathayae TaxID=3081768 RepID=A0ABZ0M4X4_9ACTN|nr:MarR family transcriptional regulator [Streptomyces sp. HUAS YS2]WOX26845.1 MarR family transcriptional regulator [Streptomyces sp. HUAS YS2]
MAMATALVRTAFLVNAAYAESARQHELTPQQGQLLCALMARPYGMGELGAVLRLAKSSLTGLVDRSERNGLVRREQDADDLRAVRVALTPQGTALAEEFYGGTCRRIERLPSTLGAAERATLVALLGRVVRDNEAPARFTEPNEGCSS